MPGPMRLATQTSDAGAAAPREGDGRRAGSIEGLRILVVEDEIMVATDLAFSLEDAGARPVGPAYSLSEGLALAERETFDAAILDLNLHGRDVFPLAERLQERQIPFIFHTGNGDRADLKSRFPDVVVCSKPTLPHRLIAAVARHIG